MPQDPKDKFQKPPYPQKKQPYPGTQSKMNPEPDYGLGTYKGCDKLKDKVALITGGDSGIGRAIAYAFACEGANVVISYQQSDDDAKETQKAVTLTGRRCLTIKGDIQQESTCRKLVDATMKEFGKVDILINNAAFQMSHNSIQELPNEEFDRTMKTNLYAMFYLCKAALPKMQQGGSIINTASIQAYQPSPNLLAYATTKGGIVTFTKALAQEVIQKGIRVNAVAPGPVWTPLIPSTMPEKKVKEFGKDTLLKRAAQPVEIAHVFVFLASQDASFVTGHVYGATGEEGIP